MPEQRKPKALYKELNKRFVIFRKAEFKNQRDAAEFLGITQKVISYIEQGIYDVNPAYIDKFVKERKMNRQWYDYGKGLMKTDGSVKPKSTLTDINDIKAQLESLQGQVNILQVRNKKMMEILDKIEKTLEKK